MADLDGKAEGPYKSVLENREYWRVMGNILEERGLKKDMDVMNIFQVQDTLYIDIFLHTYEFQDNLLEKEVFDVCQGK